ncbi:MAG: hypothetical protein QW067_12780, partial [Thermofilaceae archaeon]
MSSPVIKITLLEGGAKVETQTPESKEEREAKKLLDLIEAGREYTQKEIVEEGKIRLGYGKDKVLKLLRLLQDKGLIRVQKSNKSTGKGYVYVKADAQTQEEDDGISL